MYADGGTSFVATYQRLGFLPLARRAASGADMLIASSHGRHRVSANVFHRRLTPVDR